MKKGVAIDYDFEKGAKILLFGHDLCSTCGAVYDSLSSRIPEDIEFVYIDTVETPALSGRFGVFTAPVVTFMLDGKEYKRWVRHFGINEILEYTQRIMDIYNS